MCIIHLYPIVELFFTPQPIFFAELCLTSFSGQVLLYRLQLSFRTVCMIFPVWQKGFESFCFILHDPALKRFPTRADLCCRCAYTYLSCQISLDDLYLLFYSQFLLLRHNNAPP